MPKCQNYPGSANLHTRPTICQTDLQTANGKHDRREMPDAECELQSLEVPASQLYNPKAGTHVGTALSRTIIAMIHPPSQIA